MYNLNNIDNTEEVSEDGTTFTLNQSKDIILNSALFTIIDDKDFILLQNFEFVNYYADKFISTTIRSDYNSDNKFTFLSDKDSKQGCIRVKVNNLNIMEFPMIATFYYEHNTIIDKLNNLRGCLI